jgi:hypothetical protein
MNKPVAFLSFALLAVSLSAVATTITPLPGVAGQTTTQATYFATNLAVQVLNDDGTPVRFTQVNFIDTDGLVFFGGGSNSAGFDFSGHDAAITDTNGIATAVGLIGFQAGTATMTISTVGTGAVSTSIQLNVVPGGPVRVEVVSGSKQKATVGTTYPQPWVVQAFDAAGNVVPNAAVLFGATTDPTLPSGQFNGFSSIFVRADNNGIAVSPPFTANQVAGKEEGTAMLLNPGATTYSAIFEYTNLAATSTGGGGGGSGDGCGAQRKGNGNCGQGGGANHGK